MKIEVIGRRCNVSGIDPCKYEQFIAYSDKITLWKAVCVDRAARITTHFVYFGNSATYAAEDPIRRIGGSVVVSPEEYSRLQDILHVEEPN